MIPTLFSLEYSGGAVGFTVYKSWMRTYGAIDDWRLRGALFQELWERSKFKSVRNAQKMGSYLM